MILKDEGYCRVPFGKGLTLFIEEERRGGLKGVLELAKKVEE